MIKRIGIAAAMLLFVPVYAAWAGDDTPEELFGRYKDGRNVEMVTISSSLLEMLAEKDGNPVLEDIDTLSVMNVKKFDEVLESYYIDNAINVAFPRHVLKDFRNSMKRNGMELFISTKKKDISIDVYRKMTGKGNYGKIACICENDDMLSVILITGRLTERLMDAMVKGEITVE